jgi:hypothetical protein
MHSVLRVGRPFILVSVLAVACILIGVSVGRAQGELKKNAKYPQHVLIIRHAEKTGVKTDIHLSKKGMERAEVLPRLFEVSKNRPKPFPTPDFIFAASNSTSSRRPLETVTPLAMKLRLPIDQTYDSKRSLSLDKNGAKEKTANAEDMHGLRAAVFGEPKYRGKTILVAWRHSTIPELAKTLGANKVPAMWENNVFDRVWQLSYDDNCNVVLLNRPQLLLPDDAEE